MGAAVFRSEYSVSVTGWSRQSQSLADYLTAEDLQDVLSELEPVKAQWNNLGLGLRLKRTDLEAIDSDHRNSLARLRAVLEIWLDTVEPRPTWRAIIQVLRSPLMSKTKSLADELERNHCYSAARRTRTVASSRGDRELSK